MYSSTSSLSNHKPSLEFLQIYTVAQNEMRMKKNKKMLKTSFGSDKKLKCILICANFRESKEHAGLSVHTVFCFRQRHASMNNAQCDLAVK